MVTMVIVVVMLVVVSVQVYQSKAASMNLRELLHQFYGVTLAYEEVCTLF